MFEGRSFRMGAGFAAAALALAGCTTQSSGFGATTAGGPGTQPAPAVSTIQPSDTVAATDLPELSDANIVAMLAMADSAEVKTGEFAESQATAKGVHDLAEMIEDDHSQNLTQLLSLASQQGITPEMPAADSAAANQDPLAALQAAPKGMTFDSLFTHHAIEDHAHEISEVKAMMAQADNPQLKSFIQTSVLPAMEKHLSTAERVAAQLH